MENVSESFFALISTLERLGLDVEKTIDQEYSYIIENYCERNIAIPKIIVVGQNPSNDSPNTRAFHKKTKSGATVRSWFKDHIYWVSYANLYNQFTPNNGKPNKADCVKMLESLEMLQTQRNCKIIACGSFVSARLTESNIPHFQMPHPSGLCRFWNDKVASEAKIKEMHNWIQNGTKI